MSLQNLAQYLAAHGRGNDKMLMHVTPNEVAGLQSIAMAAGGSLSVNPETGLPEAGFFDFLGNIFPQIAGTAIGAAIGGPYGAAIGAGTAGAIETARSGNLLSGIMAGLGAYGGANLFQGVANAAPGAASATGAGASTAGLPSAAQLGSSATAAQQAGQAPLAGMVGTPAGVSTQTAALQAAQAADPLGFAGTLTEGAKLGTAPFGGSVGAQTGIASPTLGTMSAKAPITFENLKAGFQNITGEGGLKSLQAGLGEAGKPITAGQLASRAALPIAQAAMSAMPGPESLTDVTDDTSSLWGKYTPLSEFRKRYRGYAQGGEIDFSNGGSTSIENYRAQYQGNQPVNNTNSVFTPAQFEQLYNQYKSDAAIRNAVFMPSFHKLGQYQNLNILGFPQLGQYQNLNRLAEQRGVSVKDLQRNPNAGLSAQQIQFNQMLGASKQPVSTNFFDSQLALRRQKQNITPQQTQFNQMLSEYNKAATAHLQSQLTPEQQRRQRVANSGMFGAAGLAMRPNVSVSSYSNPLNIWSNKNYAQGGVLEQNPMMDDTSRQNLNLDMREHPLGEMNGLTGGYAKGGYLDGPGDGMSDDIPATIEGKQPARLADGEFVVPADVVSHLGNGSTKAGAKRLYEMMARVRKARTGNEKQGKQINPNKFVPT